MTLLKYINSVYRRLILTNFPRAPRFHGGGGNPHPPNPPEGAQFIISPPALTTLGCDPDHSKYFFHGVVGAPSSGLYKITFYPSYLRTPPGLGIRYLFNFWCTTTKSLIQEVMILSYYPYSSKAAFQICVISIRWFINGRNC